MCPISNIGSGECVCVPSRCVPSIKLRGGTKSWVFFCVCGVPSHFFLGVPSNGINRVRQTNNPAAQVVFNPKKSWFLGNSPKSLCI